MVAINGVEDILHGRKDGVAAQVRVPRIFGGGDLPGQLAKAIGIDHSAPDEALGVDEVLAEPANDLGEELAMIAHDVTTVALSPLSRLPATLHLVYEDTMDAEVGARGPVRESDAGRGPPRAEGRGPGPARAGGRGLARPMVRGLGFLLLLLGLVPSFYWLSPLLFRFWASRSPEVLFRVPTAERAVALTIDDGPDPDTTPEILDVLERHGARATFFLLGSRAERHPGLVAEIVARGHEIANHMWLDVPSRSLDSATFERRLLRAHRVLSRFAEPGWLRPGSGWYDERIVRRATAHGYRIVLGTIYAFDTTVRWPGLVARFIVAWARPGSVVILHDVEGRGVRTAETLRRALPELERRGYRVTTLSTLSEAGAQAESPRAGRSSAGDRGALP